MYMLVQCSCSTSQKQKQNTDKAAPEAEVNTMEPPFLFFIITFAAPFNMLKEDQVLA